MPCILETARQTPVVQSCDVLVCGGGPAGVAAAIASARAGARTWLLELRGSLGGIWTCGLLPWILDTSHHSDWLCRLIEDLRRQDMARIYQGAAACDVEQMKRILEAQCAEAGVNIRLHTRCVAAQVDQDHRLRHVITESKSGREAWSARVFIDATGDGDVAALAGCGFDIGRPSDHATQPASLIALVTGIDLEKAYPFVRGEAELRAAPTPKQRLLEEMRRAGFEPSYSQPSLHRTAQGLFALMANHQYGVCATDADSITQATLKARIEVHRCVEALRSLGGIWQSLRLVATAEQIGIREGRRIHGRETVTCDDLVAGRRHPDAVCRVHMRVDVHSTSHSEGKAYDDAGIRSQPYDIPYGALIARDVGGLLLAGRCISGDFLAHASYRVTGDAAAMGEAAGRAAALAARSDCLPDQLRADRFIPPADQTSS